MFGAIVRPRAGGKSYQLAQLALRNTHAVVVVLNDVMKRHFTANFGVPPEQVITIQAMLDGALRGRFTGPLLVDDFDEVLRHMFYDAGVRNTNEFIIAATGVNL